MNRIVQTLVLTSIFFGLASCSEEQPTQPPPPSSKDCRVRLLHFVHDGPGLDLYVNGQKLATNVAWGKSSGYKKTTPGQFNVAVHRTGDTVAAKSSLQLLADATAHTVYAFPPNAAFAAAFKTDAVETSVDKCRIKFVNATYSPVREDYEIYVTGTNSKILGPISRTQVTDYTDRFAGNYSFTLKKLGDPDFNMTFKPVLLNGASAYTIVLHGTSDETDAWPLRVRMFTDAGGGDQYVDLELSPEIGHVLFANAAWGSGKVDVSVDEGVPQVTNLNYGANTTYASYGSGSHTVSAAAGSVTVANKAAMNLGVNEYNTYFFVGSVTPPNLSTMQLKDITVPSPASALVRFVNLSPDAGKVNVIVPLGPGNDYNVPGMQNIGFKEVSVSTTTPGENFLSMPPGDYSMKFYHVAADSVYRQKFNLKFDAGKIYTLWYGGLVSDNSLNSYIITHN